MASSPREAPCETQDTARFAPQSQVNAFLRLVDPGAGATSAQPQQVSSAIERAGAEVGFVAARFIARSLRWLDSRQESVVQVRSESRDEVTGSRHQAMVTPSVEAAVPTQPIASETTTRLPTHFQRADLPRQSAALRRQPTSVPLNPQRQQTPVSNQSIARMQRVEQPRTPKVQLPQEPAVVPAAPRASREPFPKAYELAAETIPPLVTLALGKWVKPSWAQLAETGCSIALNATRIYQEAAPRNNRPRSSFTALASATFAIASTVATISASGLVSLAATSPWIVALIGGVLLLAIIWRAMESRGANGALSWPGAVATAMG